MKLSSLLLGDLADLFQDDRIDNIERRASKTDAWTDINRTRLERLAVIVEERMQEVEAENAILGMIVARLLKHMGGREPEETAAIIDEIREVLKTSGNPPRGLDFLCKALEISPVTKTPIQDFKKPPFVPPRLPNLKPVLKLPGKRPGDAHKP